MRKIVTATVYIADDGERFPSQEACEEHERHAYSLLQVLQQIRHVTVDFDDDPTRGFPYDTVNVVRICTREQWKAWTNRAFPEHKPFAPLTVCEYSEAVGSCNDEQEYATRTMDPLELADVLEQQARRLRDAVRAVLQDDQ